MSRPRLPTNVLELRGSFKKDPQRARPLEPEPPSAIGDPPDYFCEKKRNIWHEILDVCHPGVFGSSDRIHLEILCCLLYKFRFESSEMKITELNQLNCLLSRSGMTPSDRSKISVSNDKKVNVFKRL